MNNLIRMIAAAAALAVASVALSPKANAGAVLDKVIAKNTLTVATGVDWGTLSFLNEKKELDGFDVDVVKGIAQRLGVQVQFVTPGWDLIAAGKWQGRWDVALGGMTPTKARAEKFDFPAIYLYFRRIALVHKDSKATKLSDLDGKVVGVAVNTTEEYYANHTLTPDWVNAQPIHFEFTPGQVKTYESNRIAYDDLRLGDGVRLDAVIMGEQELPELIKAGYPFKQLGAPLFSSPGAVVIERGDKEFGEKIAAAIQSMRDDGTLSQLSVKWYGVDYTTEN
ncbi:transporter substrate-binding domain-containing protein [Mesorhizobium captivum]|uniref:transporter substrate-binding domain-containing protein n=1 Tax=Mesorhizobium captivum TaxID=3072319 RepID=UPI002A23CD4F|nr:transporter substrate-binding domain-containing protein [Mesorhizobium sp. VK3C]MDX8449891.1 transporter substrate-binding domain-containing protein [Mesorhizobium sp. VK3C]